MEYNFVEGQLYQQKQMEISYTNDLAPCKLHLDCFDCTALLINPFEPHMSSVKCDTKLLNIVICISQKNTVSQTTLLSHMSIYCHDGHFLKDTKCYSFTWYNKTVQMSKKTIAIKDFVYIFEAISDISFPPILSPDLQSYTLQRRIHNNYQYEEHKLHSQFKEGFYIKEQNSLHFMLGEIFSSAETMSSYQLSLCVINILTVHQRNNQMKSTVVHQTDLHRSKGYNRSNYCPLLHMSHNRECQMYVLAEDKMNYFAKNVKQEDVFDCANGQKILMTMVNDLVPDCLPFGEDENELKSIMEDKAYFLCSKKGEIPCRPGHSKCYDISSICQFKFNTLGFLTPCRTGEHLQECKDFQCNKMFKCPNFYCIPWGYVCNGVWDCPGGADEHSFLICGTKRNCSGLFKCRLSTICLHHGAICDNLVDCPQGDDEYLCSLKTITCPLSCFCLAHAVSCQSTSVPFGDFQQIFIFRVVHLQDTNVYGQNLLFCFPLLVVTIRNTNLQSLCFLSCASWTIKHLDVGSNAIRTLQTFCLSNNSAILSMKLDNNLIKDLQPLAFNNFSHLALLNLSSNPLHSLSQNMFGKLFRIKVLSLFNMKHLEVCEKLLIASSAVIIESFEKRIYCLFPMYSQCFHQASCPDFLLSLLIKIILSVVIAAQVLLNTCSAIFHVFQIVKKTSMNHSFKILICTLNFSDVTCALPYVILQVASVTFQDNFSLHEESWRGNPLCFVAFCIFLNYSLLCPVLLFLISLSRLVGVSKPLNIKLKDVQFVSKCMGTICVFVFIFAAALTSQISLEDYGLPNSFCFPITNQSAGSQIIQFVSEIIACWKIFIFLLLFTMNIDLINLINNSQQKQKYFVSKQRTSKSITVHMGIQMFCLSICWIPCVVLCLLLLCDKEYHKGYWFGS